MKALIRYMHGTPPHAVMTGTEEQLVAALSEQFEVMEHNGFYFDKKNPRTSPPLRRMLRAPHPPHDYYIIVDTDKWQNKQNKTKLNETDVPADGRKRWGGGAWVIAFVYSNKGNFVLKGYHHEVESHLTGLGLRYFVNYTMWSGGQHRDWWQISAKDVRISEPCKHNRFRWTITKRGRDWTTITELKFKRLPKSWVPEIDALTR